MILAHLFNDIWYHRVLSGFQLVVLEQEVFREAGYPEREQFKAHISVCSQK